MLRALLIASMTRSLPDWPADFIVGIDRGALFCVQNRISMDIAIGDFDSVSETELESIRSNCKEIIRLDPVKDVTDTQAALELVASAEEIWLCGGLGGRIDHQLINIGLVRSDLRLKLWDEQHLIYAVSGEKNIKKAGYRYLSLFAAQPSVVSLTGVKYPLTDRKIDLSDLYLVSNEILEEEAYLAVEGRVLVIQSNDA